tara:strand:- start:1753 stop:1941 length:189 start_codon:yes stop_codon:yes gene_type:complete
MKLFSQRLTDKLYSKLLGKKEISNKKFDPNIRIDAENLSEKEKMDKGFNGKTYTINGIEYDF